MFQRIAGHWSSGSNSLRRLTSKKCDKTLTELLDPENDAELSFETSMTAYQSVQRNIHKNWALEMTDIYEPNNDNNSSTVSVYCK